MHGNNSLKIAILAVLLIAALLTSGCIKGLGGTTTTGKGVVILDFKPDFTQVHSRDKVKLQLRVQNTGEVKARNVKAEIAGIDLSEWRGRSTGENLGDLLGVDKATNTPGAVRTKYWELTAPSLPAGTSFKYEPIVKVSYDYKTTAVKAITLVDSDELRRIIQQGRRLEVKPVETSAGPLDVEVQTGEFVRTGRRDVDYDIFPLYIKVINTLWEQGGTVVPKTTRGGDYPVQLKITLPQGTTFVHTGYGSDCGRQVTVDLWQGKDAEITCEVRVTRPPEYRQDKLINIELDYRYQVEASTEIEVVGTRTR